MKIGEIMANEQKNTSHKKTQVPNNVVEMPKRCPAEECEKKAERSTFCNEHFDWFKAGLISRDGVRPKDFDKKYQAYLRKQNKKVA